MPHVQLLAEIKGSPIITRRDATIEMIQTDKRDRYAEEIFNHVRLCKDR